MGKTSIEWTRGSDDAPGYSWNPIRARNRKTGKLGWFCIHASDGCINCYSETRNRWVGTQIQFKAQNRDAVETFLDRRMLGAPLHWKQPGRLFVCSMTDLFAPFVPDDWIDDVIGVAAAAPRHTFLVLTKRAERQRHYCRDRPQRRANVWHGVSVENRATLDRLDDLRATPAALRFVSFEPLLEDLGVIDLTGISWGIVGAESDPRRRARPMQLDWVRSLRDQCIAAGVPFFLKQTAERGRKIATPELDGKKWIEFPR